MYCSELLESLLDRYWANTKSMIFYRLFLPYCTYATATIYYFTTLLKDKQDSDGESDYIIYLKPVLTLMISPFWVYKMSIECMQLKSLKCRYFKSIWNWTDLVGLISTALAIFFSYEPFSIPMSLTRGIASLASMLIIVKFFDWLRLFESTAIMILLVKHTLIDIGHFMIVYFFALLMFGFPLVILNQNRSNDDG